MLDSHERNFGTNYEISSSGNEGIYNSTSRREVQATKQKNENGHGYNKANLLKGLYLWMSMKNSSQLIIPQGRYLHCWLSCKKSQKIVTWLF